MNQSIFEDWPKAAKQKKSKPAFDWKNQRIIIEWEVDFKFWSTGAINLNLHCKALEIEILCFQLTFTSFNPL